MINNEVIPNSTFYEIRHMAGLDSQTCQRLHCFGIHPGTYVSVVRTYPFNGPVVIAFEHQQLGLRYADFQAIIRED